MCGLVYFLKSLLHSFISSPELVLSQVRGQGGKAQRIVEQAGFPTLWVFRDRSSTGRARRVKPTNGIMRRALEGEKGGGAYTRYLEPRCH